MLGPVGAGDYFLILVTEWRAVYAWRVVT